MQPRWCPSAVEVTLILATFARVPLVACVALWYGAALGTASPLDDALTVWHMGDRSEAISHGESLDVKGDVQLGQSLSGSEREASLGRGGDGRVARFNGGYLRLRSPGNQAIEPGGKEMTLCLRLAADANGWAALLARDAPGDPYGMILDGRDGVIRYQWRTEPAERRVNRPAGNVDFLAGVLRLRVPLSLIDPSCWHDVVVRFRGPNLELFVDGVLVDEDWPHGGLFGLGAPFLLGAGYENGKLRTGFRGRIDHVALWNRALRDEEITALAGGREEVARRDREILGPEPPSPQYWKPRGYNAFAGDCMPFFHDGTFHLFYLFDRRHHGSKWGQGAHQYAHVSTRDLVHWEHHPLAVPIARQWECSMGTCDCIWHNGVYHMFYTDCGDRCEYRDKPQRGAWIFQATSTDGIHFQKDFKPLVPGGDCTVFQDPATGQFQLVRGGGNRLVSQNLVDWKEIPGEFVARKPGTTGECPHLFRWNGWFYFLLGTNAIWKSKNALGPWQEMEPTIYDGLFVPKVAEFTGNRRILAGFLFERGWAGHLALRELVQDADGSLGIKFPPELIPKSGPPLALGLVAGSPLVTGDPSRIAIKAGKRLVTGALAGVPRNVRIGLHVVPKPGSRAFGLCLRSKGDYEGGCELRFEPDRQRAQYGVPQNHGLAKDSTDPICRGRDFALAHVQRLDQPFDLDILVKDDIIDASIDGRRTMITRRDPEPEGDQLVCFVQEGDVSFERIVVRPLAP